MKIAGREWSWVWSLVLALAAGCSDEQPQRAERAPGPDAAPLLADGGGRADGEVPFSLPPGGAGHPEVGVALSTGQVRAGRTTAADQLLPGIKSTGRVGDFKIYNSRVAFLIGDERPSSGYAPYGGEILDGVRLAPGAPGGSLLGELIFSVGVHLLKAHSVGVVNDGSDGKPAMIRVIGEPAPFPMLASVLSGLASEPLLRLVVEYELAADSDFLEVRWRYFNRTKQVQEITMLAVGITSGDGAELFSEEVGFVVNDATAQDYAAMIGTDIAYALYSPEAPLSPLIQKEGVWVLSTSGPKVPAAGEVQRRYRLLLAEGEPEAVRRGIRAVRGEPEPLALTGTVRAGQAPLGGVRVHAERDAGDRRYVSMTRTDQSGAYRLALGPGSYRVTPVADGRGAGAPVTVKIDTAAASADLEVPEGALLHCTVSDDKGPLPVRLTLKPGTPFPSLPASFGEPSWPAGSLVLFSASGKESLALPVGTYSVLASRGFEYEIDQTSVSLAAGEEKSVALKLTRSVSTTGYMSGDFHVHAMWSPDSSDLYEMKAAALAGEGLEIPVITEHEYLGDLNPAVAKLGLQPWLRSMVGEEITTFVYGHFNAYPLTQDPGKPNQGALRWYEKSPGTVFAEAHATWPGSVVQVNHPRSSAQGGYFSAFGYDPALGVATKKPSEWSRAFDAIEVFNGSGWSSNQSSTVKDWYSFLDRGFLVTATGNSDSHHALWDNVGYPRNYVKLSTDEPAKLDVSELAKAVREGRVVVSGGPFVTASIGGKSLGEVVDATSKQVNLAVTVQAPSWISVDKLRVIVSGQTVLETAIDASTRDPQNPATRFQKELPVMADRDSWVIVVVTGPADLAPVCPGRQPFAVTNPIYLDVDGNGRYDPPKSF